MSSRTGLYIHIPFCVRKCNYCAFLSFASDYRTRAAYTEALCREIRTVGESMCESKRPELKPGIETVYFGGGTPSVMETELLAKIMAAVRDSFELVPDAEITIEVNPGTLGAYDCGAEYEPAPDSVILEKLSAFKGMGFNRLSMGVQSMDDRRLKFLGRIHTADDVIRDVRLARQAGFDNINLDLIFSVPGETGADALRDAEALIALGPEHISCYSLQLEEDTPFYRMAESGEIHEVPDEEDRDTYHRICARLRDAGYEHYEISNFAKMPDGRGRGFAYSYGDGDNSADNPSAYGVSANQLFENDRTVNDRSPFRSRHNSMYWDMSDYIGAGLGASSFVNGVRYRNTADLNEYLHDRISAEKKRTAEAGPDADSYTDADTDTNDPLPYLPRTDESHTNSAFDNISEAVFTGLRRREGIAYSEAVSAYESCSSTVSREQCNKERFWEIYEDAAREAHEYAEGGLLVIDEHGMRLTERGIDISNGIMSLFV